MKQDHDILKKDDLIELTGCHYSSQQCEWLTKAGIWFTPRRDGTPSTTWYHVANPIPLRGIVSKPVSDEPNFNAIQ
ncbi:DUF4224 domain-containing protein [Jinshanibacter sp. LJY008]|uniref:DUF4224 domain-containing protein n=1 Tax=Limnobaculum eriocheiris TaxID=2897391 RepID=A0A9X1SJH0_9GAMM|nr:DUF4224 domain-containing protein [Limnobaculum eriocheiris]MCD1124851.1 DUF4224 domain-containing protein [Limnobaculum eriocheiris]